MTEPGPGANQQADWDSAVEALAGDLLQLWNWGDFKQRYGWEVERVVSAGGSRAQILFRHVGPFSLAYIPRGPVFAGQGQDDLDLLQAIDAACARHRAIMLLLEPGRPVPDAWLCHGPGFRPAFRTIQSPRTVLVDLTLDDDTLLQQMRKDTRYNISYAQRRGMTVERPDLTRDSLDQFFSLLSETAHRAEFGIHNRAYYADFLTLFRDRSVLLFAHYEGAITAGLVASRFGSSARSMYAGTRRGTGARGDAALLRFAAMQWARENGCTTYDLGGIAPRDPESPADGSQESDIAASLKGVETFKTGFGGQVFDFPETLERVYHPRLLKIARRFQDRASRSAN